jgi:NAD(P)-dependent dehydrogenase (short-subunit alcohol dehydrogenase family)
MREHRSGCIVNVTSIAGRVTLPGQGAYAASKWAMEAICEILGAEVAPFGIRVAIVEPGVVQTAIVDKAMRAPLDTDSPYFEWTIRTGRLLLSGLVEPSSADDVAETIWHAISTDSPVLRYRVGRDADAISASRATLTDEEWISGLTMVDDEQWRKNMKAWTATDVPPLG